MRTLTLKEHKRIVAKAHYRFKKQLAEALLKCQIKMYPRSAVGRKLYELIINLEHLIKK